MYIKLFLFLSRSSLCVAFISLHDTQPPIPVQYGQLVNHCVQLHSHDHTQEPSIGLIALLFTMMQEGCGFRAYGFKVKKSLTSP